MEYKTIPASVEKFINEIVLLCNDENPKWGKVFKNTFADTLLTTIKRQNDGTTFVLTGDIPAMWLRDSTAQVRPYLLIAKNDPEIADMIVGVINKQFEYINIDPYANAFNETDSFAGHQADNTKMNGWIWERKYEIDSLCYPVQLAYLMYLNTGRTDQFNQNFVNAVEKILTVFTIEQNHENSDYFFERHDSIESDTLPCKGLGNPVKPTGLIWSGFRPSDDACKYGYLIPANMFAVVILGYLEHIFNEIIPNSAIVEKSKKIKKDIISGIQKEAVVDDGFGNLIYAYEIDGNGNYTLMDDANVPSLLSIPYLNFTSNTDIIYQNTRKFILSKKNPYYYSGKYVKGIGSPHTPDGFVWPIALSIEGLTSFNKSIQKEILNTLVTIDNDTNMMHESIDPNNPENYTRPWFSWSNMMFCELVLDYFNITIKK